MKLIAIRPIHHAGGTIRVDHQFEADERFAKRVIEQGKAVPVEQYTALPVTGSGYWQVQPEWKGETVVIIGGGPSVSFADVASVWGNARAIAINNSVTLAPWADLLYFCDARWYEWHADEIGAFERQIVTLENLALQKKIPGLRCLRDYGATGMAPRNDGVTNGRNSGFQALQLARWLGAARVLLLGFDMRAVDGRMHWHAEHPIATPQNITPGWTECFNQIALDLQRLGVDVINCTPNSALTVFPYQPLAVALGIEPPQPSAAEIAHNDSYIATLAARDAIKPRPVIDVTRIGDEVRRFAPEPEVIETKEDAFFRTAPKPADIEPLTIDTGAPSDLVDRSDRDV